MNGVSHTIRAELNAKNKVIAINTFAILVMTCSFNIINWTLAETKEKQKIGTKVRKLITCHRMNRPRTDIERVYVKRENSGKELIQLELTSKTSTIGLKK